LGCLELQNKMAEDNTLPENSSYSASVALQKEVLRE
jgi:hypothetical protein